MSTSANPQKENKMGVMPINKLLITMSLPVIISMLVQAFYNIVDSMFVSWLSEEALTAVSLAFPFQNLMIGVGVGTGVGINALLSKNLGEKNYDVANKTAVNGLFLALCSTIVFAVLGFFAAPAFFQTQTAIPEIIGDGVTYLRICTVFSVGIFFSITFERLLQATGRTIYTMISQATGAVINIILDPILIFGLFGFPKMGVVGAAIATVIGQVGGALLGLYFNLSKNKELTFKFRGFRPSFDIIKRIYAVGIPSIVMNSIGSAMNFGMNQILIGFTETATAVFGVYFKLQSFVFMPVFGLNNGMVPIISYNYGARKRQRIVDTIKYSLCYAFGMMFLGLAAFWLFTPQLLGIFNASETMLEIGIPALRIISLSYLFAGGSIITLSVCQALGRGMLSLFISAMRQLLVLLPTAFILSKVGGLSAVWWAYPVADLFALCLCGFFLLRIYRTVIAPLDDAAAPAADIGPAVEM